MKKGSLYWDALERMITPTNVNCIPHHCKPPKSWENDSREDYHDLVGYAKEVIHEDHFGNYTAVVEKIFCRDLGDLNWIGAPQWLNRVCTDYKQRRIECQNAVFFVICWLSRYYTKDVVQLVARVVWATRHSEDWNLRVLFSRLMYLL
jgi:hypothetical protein